MSCLSNSPNSCSLCACLVWGTGSNAAILTGVGGWGVLLCQYFHVNQTKNPASQYIPQTKWSASGGIFFVVDLGVGLASRHNKSKLCPTGMLQSWVFQHCNLIWAGYVRDIFAQLVKNPLSQLVFGFFKNSSGS